MCAHGISTMPKKGCDGFRRNVIINRLQCRLHTMDKIEKARIGEKQSHIIEPCNSKRIKLSFNPINFATTQLFSASKNPYDTHVHTWEILAPWGYGL